MHNQTLLPTVATEFYHNHTAGTDRPGERASEGLSGRPTPITRYFRAAVTWSYTITHQCRNRMDPSRMRPCITRTFGREATLKRIPEWLAALREGYAKTPRCGAETVSGAICGRLPMRGGNHCHLHLHGEERTLVDRERVRRAKTRLNSMNARHRLEASSALRSIARRELHLHWRHQNPDAPGSTFVLPDGEEMRLLRHLIHKHGIDIQAYRHEGFERERPLSARAIDRIRWAGVLELTRRISAESAGNRVRAAIRDDVRWFTKHGW